MGAMPLLEVSDLACRQGDRLIVERVDLSVSRGEVLGLLGLNGAGKTTTLRMICGTLAPSRGSIHINGLDLLDEPLAAKRSLGYLPEIPPVHAETTVTEYLRFAAMVRRVPADALASAVERALARCGLLDVRRRLIRNLSRGYRQRVGIAQAIIHEPLLMVLDEPSAGLDPKQADAMRSLIAEMREHCAVIFSSHILPEVQALCDRVVILHEGRQVYSGAPATDDDERPCVTVRFAHPPAPEALRGLPGVQEVVADGEALYRVCVESESRLDQITAKAVESGWGLREMTRRRRTVEQVFLELTTGETAA